MDKGAWWATVHGVNKSWTWVINTLNFELCFIDYAKPFDRVHAQSLSRVRLFVALWAVAH